MKFLPLILKNSLRSKRRTLLTILSIAASLCLLGVLGALYHMFFLAEATEESSLRLVVRNRISITQTMPLFYRDKIATIPGVEEAMVYQWFGGVYKEGDAQTFFARYAVDEGRLFTVYPEYRLTPEERQAFLSERTACIVGRKLADQMGFEIGDKVPLQGDIFPVNLELTIRGIYESKVDNESLLFHLDYLNEALRGTYMDSFADMAGTFAVRVESAEEIPRIANAIDDMFRNATAQTKTETEKQFALSFLSFLGNVKLFLLSICGAVTFTIMLVSGNTMAMAVRERVREVGVLKTLGFTRATILAVLVSEAVLISLIGGVLGLALATGICAMMRQMPSVAADTSRIVMPAFVWWGALAVAALIGVISSIVPAWGASRRPIVEALRYTD